MWEAAEGGDSRALTCTVSCARLFRTPSGGSPGAHGEGGEGAEGDDSEESIEAVENMLESYFMQIDSSYDRLVSVGAQLCAAWACSTSFLAHQC